MGDKRRKLEKIKQEKGLKLFCYLVVVIVVILAS